MVKLVVGLGNPGARYAFTRHNVGFMVVDVLAQRWNVRISEGGCGSLFARIGDGVYLIKPQTYVNESGKAVVDWMSRGFSPQEMLVVHDDIDLPFGVVRVKHRGGTGGHRGLQSIIEEIGSEGFPRVRVGVGRPAGREHDHQAIVDFLLSPFGPEEEGALIDALRLAADAVEMVLRKGVNYAINLINRRNSVSGGGDSEGKLKEDEVDIVKNF